MRHALLLTSLAAVLSACDALSGGDPVAYAHLPEREALRVPTAGTTVIRSDPEWTAFWQTFAGRESAVPAVDFSRQTVAVVTYGQDVGCRHAVETVMSVERESGAVEAHLRELPFLGHCRGGVYPNDVVVIDARLGADEALRFVGRRP